MSARNVTSSLENCLYFPKLSVPLKNASISERFLPSVLSSVLILFGFDLGTFFDQIPVPLISDSPIECNQLLEVALDLAFEQDAGFLEKLALATVPSDRCCFPGVASLRPQGLRRARSLRGPVTSDRCRQVRRRCVAPTSH